MKTSSRPRDVGGSFGSRRGHANQLSISDTSHHVTEAIGDMYGDDEYSKRDSRPLSYLASPLLDPNEERESFHDASKSFANRAQTRPPPSTNGYSRSQTTPSRMPSQKNSQFDVNRVQRSGSLDQGGALSPTTRSFRDGNPMDPSSPHSLPLEDLDYDSSPAAVAAELSNLQALRRMSMDVGNTSDPDLPSFSNMSFIPSVAPKGGDDDDPSRLFWVPAAVHPELAPKEFKTFIEDKVQSIKRRSGDQSSLSPDSIERSGSMGGGLRRKKSMLSRQIDNSGGRGAIGYHDGAEHLERKRSLAGQKPELTIASLQEFDNLVRDPTKLQAANMEPLKEMDEDMPILPAAPGLGLRRSTHTTYRKGGSLKRGERLPYSKRVGAKAAEAEGDKGDTRDAPAGHGLQRVQSEPITENFSRPGRRRGGIIQQTGTPLGQAQAAVQDEISTRSLTPAREPEPTQQLPVRTSSMNDRREKVETPIPQILETPPIEEQQTRQYNQQYQYPERTVSQSPSAPAPPSIQQPQQQKQQQQSQPQPQPQQQSQRLDDTPSRLTKRQGRQPGQTSPTSQNMPQTSQSTSPGRAPATTFSDMAQQPSLLPGNRSRTDELTFIPTLTDDRSRLEKKKSDDSSSKKGGWGWFKNSDEKEKKSKSKEDEYKKTRSRSVLEKTHDNARLDVLNTTIDPAATKGRESLVLDRESLDSKLSDERRRESNRRAAGEGKKEKDSLFSSLFGGGKKKGDRESGHKKGNSLRAISPEPTIQRPLRPDIDYPWTRFTLLEERAIYRMAHIKLANPRRALLSQVLLSNFMYSYLAKVQQMHPHVQVPQSAQQKKAQQQQEAERKQREQEQQYSEQQDDGYKYDYHQGIAQYAEQGNEHEQQAGSYVDDSQIYNYDHQDDDPRQQNSNSNRPHSRQAQHEGDGRNGNQYGRQDGRQDQYYMYNQSNQQYHNNDEGDMW